jgi:chemotaxis protein methyltransferase CheR
VSDNIFHEKLKHKDFLKLKDYIESHCGIKLSETKSNMIEGRLRKRVKALGMKNYAEYIEYALNSGDDVCENYNLIDVITTNKTDFFREPNHFELMTKKILPYLHQNFDLGGREKLNVWSSASSTGEEPYTIAMVLAEYFGVGGNFNIFATDINTEVLKIGRKAVYKEQTARDIPIDLKKKYMLRSIDRAANLVRFKPEIRKKVNFGRNNLKSEKYTLPCKVDIAFCRNVIIYFDTKTQQEIINRICSYIKPGGFLFMGHSESIHGLDLPIKNFAPTVYVRN